ncbi:MAG: hypothetical protein HY550_02925 [Elusimicrobia bacterium]|nr:hypothetical protein [Elusimicrobiota bacterium]
MWTNENIILLVSCAAAALLALLLLRPRKSAAKAAPADEGERSPVPVEGSTAFTGMHKGVKYWVFFEKDLSRMEIGMGEEVTAPFLSDRRPGTPKLPGDPRDLEVRELFKLRAQYVEASVTGNLIAAQFPDRVLNANAGSPVPPAPDEAAANKVAELLAAIREKSREPSGKPAR